MNNSSKKTAFVLIGILTISLFAGNILFAGDRGSSASGLVIADDVSFISSGFTSTTASNNSPDAGPFSDVINAEDAAVASAPYNGALVASGPSGKGSSQNVVNAADIGFVSNGSSGFDSTNLVCVVDGVQITGSRCIVN